MHGCKVGKTQSSGHAGEIVQFAGSLFLGVAEHLLEEIPRFFAIRLSCAVLLAQCLYALAINWLYLFLDLFNIPTEIHRN